MSRLHARRADLLPFLKAIVDHRAEVDGPRGARTARRLADELGREPAEARSGNWLLPASRAAPGGTGERLRGITLLGPSRLLSRLRDSDRAAPAATLGMLRHHKGWRRVSAALIPGRPAHGDGSPAAEPAGSPSSATLTVVATGPPARVAARDAEVLAAAGPMSMAVEADLAAVLVADVCLPLTPPSLVDPTGRSQPAPEFTGTSNSHRRLGVS